MESIRIDTPGASGSPLDVQRPSADGRADLPGVRLRYAFEAGEQQGAALDNPLFELLEAVVEGGSIRHAARLLGSSYRHVWGALRKWEGALGEPLVGWSQGQRSRLTDFAMRLLWAERRARTRMQPHIEALRADLSRIVAEARDQRQPILTVLASHDLALPILQQHVTKVAHLRLDLGFQGSVDALRALAARRCMVAGFHVPATCDSRSVFAQALKPWLKPPANKLIACARRLQGLMMRSEHANRVSGPADVARLRLRFANRQPGSGTRLLIDHLVQSHGLAATCILGYGDHIEQTHVAVALCIASGVADVGVGIQTAALQFGLHFVPLVEEDYFLACQRDSIRHCAIERLREVLAGPRWREILNGLPGYRAAEDPGALLEIDAVLPWWRCRVRTRGTR